MSIQSFTDQLNRTINVPFPPKRIVSTVPSQSELLFYLGLEEEVVGITKFCVHPEAMFRSKPRIGGTKSLKLDKIAELQPDLIIGNKEENQKEHIEALERDFPVWLSDIKTLEDALKMIRSVGALTNRAEKANTLAADIKAAFDQLRQKRTSPRRPSAAYLIWNNPKMVAASDTFIDHMLMWAGFRNSFSHLSRYPAISELDLFAQKPDYVLLSSEPFPFKDKHVKEIQDICPESVIKLVDGELFSWYGCRLLHSVPYFETLFR